MERQVGRGSGLVVETVLVKRLKMVIMHSVVAGCGVTTKRVGSDADRGVNCWCGRGAIASVGTVTGVRVSPAQWEDSSLALFPPSGMPQGQTPYGSRTECRWNCEKGRTFPLIPHTTPLHACSLSRPFQRPLPSDPTN